MALAYSIKQCARGEDGGHSPHPPDRWIAAGEAAVQRAFQDRESGLWVEVTGEVLRVLPDDTQGARHQRFILRLSGGHTLLVSHNIDLAPRLPELAREDRVAARGVYEWNAEGGLIHWTHHDPQGHRPGGWLEWKGRRFE